MGIEIERKFLIKSIPDSYIDVVYIIQVYLLSAKNHEVRLRGRYSYNSDNITFDKADYNMGIKIGGNKKSRKEFEFRIPGFIFDNLCVLLFSKSISKTRYIYKNKITVDKFEDGMLLLEIEYISEDASKEIPPEFLPVIIKEVTNDPNYYNQNLAKRRNNIL